MSSKQTEDIVLGIDIGGTGIKGAPVEVATGALRSERYRVHTPHPATPAAVSEVVAKIAQHFDWRGLMGCTFPAVIKKGVAYSAANVDDGWIDADVHAWLSEATGCPLVVLNDADAAGIAEMTFGAGKGQSGVVFMLTFGTGIGSAVFVDGALVPNTELGHIELDGKEVEPWASEKAREDEALSWKKWAKRVEQYLEYLERLFSPDLFIIGGGVSKKSDKFVPRFKTRVPVVPAELLNEAGIVGAALWAASTMNTKEKAAEATKG